MRKKFDYRVEGILLFYGVLIYARFFKHSMVFHSTPMGWMQQYDKVLVVTIGIVVFFSLFFSYAYQRVRYQRKRNLLCLSFLMVSLWSMMYWFQPYFGSTDIYAWTILLFSSLLLFWQKVEWMIPVLALLSCTISPMSILSVGVLYIVFLGQKYITSEGTKYRTIGIVVALAEMMGVAVTMLMGYFSKDVQVVMSQEKMIVTLIFWLPYAWVLFHFMMDSLKQCDNRKEKWFCRLFPLGGLPSLILWIGMGDYVRALCNLIYYYGFSLIFAELIECKLITDTVDIEKINVKQKLPLPEIFVIYPLIFVVFWMVGVDILAQESILANFYQNR